MESVFNFLFRKLCHLPLWLEAKESVSHQSEDQPSATIWIGQAWDRCPEVEEAKRGWSEAGLGVKMSLPRCRSRGRFSVIFGSGKGSN